MCNSYNNGHCNYYGVEVRELNYKCERGKCMKIVCQCGSDTFHKTIENFIMCTECGCLIDMSTGQKVGGVYIGQSKPIDELIERG